MSNVVTAEGASSVRSQGARPETRGARRFPRQAGTQDYAKDAPVNLIFVADTRQDGRRFV